MKIKSAIFLSTMAISSSAFAVDPTPEQINAALTAINTILLGDSTDLTVSLKADSPIIAKGGKVTYTAEVKNNGSDAVENVQLVFNLPPKAAVTQVDLADSSCLNNGKTVTCNLGKVEPTASGTNGIQKDIYVTFNRKGGQSISVATKSTDATFVDDNTTDNIARLSVKVN